MTNTHTQTKWEEWSKKWHLAPLTTILLIKIELKVQEITENKGKKQDYEMLQTRFEPTFSTWAPQLNLWSIHSQTAVMQYCSAPEKKALRTWNNWKWRKYRGKKDYETLQARSELKFPTWAPQLNVWSIHSQTAFMQHCSSPEKKGIKNMQWWKVKKIKKKQDYETLQTRFEPKFPTWTPQLNVWSIQSQMTFMQHCSAPEKKALKTEGTWNDWK